MLRSIILCLFVLLAGQLFGASRVTLDFNNAQNRLSYMEMMFGPVCKNMGTIKQLAEIAENCIKAGLIDRENSSYSENVKSKFQEKVAGKNDQEAMHIRMAYAFYALGSGDYGADEQLFNYLKIVSSSFDVEFANVFKILRAAIVNFLSITDIYKHKADLMRECQDKLSMGQPITVNFPRIACEVISAPLVEVATSVVFPPAIPVKKPTPTSSATDYTPPPNTGLLTPPRAIGKVKLADGFAAFIASRGASIPATSPSGIDASTSSETSISETPDPKAAFNALNALFGGGKRHVPPTPERTAASATPSATAAETISLDIITDLEEMKAALESMAPIQPMQSALLTTVNNAIAQKNQDSLNAVFSLLKLAENFEGKNKFLAKLQARGVEQSDVSAAKVERYYDESELPEEGGVRMRYLGMKQKKPELTPEQLRRRGFSTLKPKYTTDPVGAMSAPEVVKEKTQEEKDKELEDETYEQSQARQKKEKEEKEKEQREKEAKEKAENEAKFLEFVTSKRDSQAVDPVSTYMRDKAKAYLDLKARENEKVEMEVTYSDISGAEFKRITEKRQVPYFMANKKEGLQFASLKILLTAAMQAEGSIAASDVQKKIEKLRKPPGKNGNTIKHLEKLKGILDSGKAAPENLRLYYLACDKHDCKDLVSILEREISNTLLDGDEVGETVGF